MIKDSMQKEIIRLCLQIKELESELKTTNQNVDECTKTLSTLENNVAILDNQISDKINELLDLLA